MEPAYREEGNVLDLMGEWGMGQSFEMQHRFDEREIDLRADRVEALANLVFLMRHDRENAERMESYVEMLERLVECMSADAMQQRIWLEQA